VQRKSLLRRKNTSPPIRCGSAPLNQSLYIRYRKQLEPNFHRSRPTCCSSKVFIVDPKDKRVIDIID